MPHNLSHMKKILLAGLLVVPIFPAAFSQQPNTKQIFRDIEKQVEYLLVNMDTIPVGPKGQDAGPRTFVNGGLKMVHPNDWTSGFFPALLWYLYEYTGKKEWKGWAQLFSDRIRNEQYSTNTHDLGFMIYCPFGNGYRLTGDSSYRSVIIQAARSLSTRFNPVPGVIRSWDHHKAEWQYPVIIDNMMNLELLFRATELTRDSSFYRIAVSHADKTLANHFRPDNSSYHVVDYNPATGAVNRKVTAQGYSDSSAWARGQAWGLYGYTMTYRFTRDPRYLRQAEAIAQFILARADQLPDLVPYWDYNAPGIPDAPKDASAAAITAAALFELAGFSKAPDYRGYAQKILASLTSHYRSPIGQNGGFLLLHSTGHHPAGSEIDVPIIYADYYYVEALMRSLQKR